MDNRKKDNLDNRTSDSSGHAIGPDTGRKVGEGVGGVSGIVTGAAIGSIGGPVGTVIGAIAGAVGGWWAGKEVSNAATTYTENNDTQYKSHFDSQASGSRGRFGSYDKARPLYQLGHVAAQNPDYRGKNFDQIEPDIKRGWNKDMEQQYGSWKDVRGTVGSAYSGANDASKSTTDNVRLTRSEEELVVSKRQVKAGEVDLKKTVETEHVSKSVPLMHEEIEVERHAISGDAADRNVEIGEQDIRIPLKAEEAVVGKRVVGKEEIVVTKHATENTKNVEADLRKERIDIDKQGRTAGTDSNTSNSDRVDNSSNR
ncbi:MAG: DUF2382 domain-containing protein [Gemmatimonadaceae bacterium]